MIRKIGLAAVSALAFAAGANAATLTGDTVGFMVSNSNAGTLISGNVTVAPGPDAAAGPYVFDLDAPNRAGTDDNGFEFTALSGNYNGLLFGDGSVTTVTLSDMDFSGGEQLVDFIPVDTSPIFLGYRILSPSSIAFDFSETAFYNYTYILEGEYVTAPVPLPAGGLLLIGGLGVMGAAAARRRKARK